MKIWISDIADKLIKKGFKSSDYDSPDLEPLIIEYLVENKFFDKLYDEMVTIEQAENFPRNAGEYREKIGEF